MAGHRRFRDRSSALGTEVDPELIYRSMEGSLQRLQVEYVDIYYRCSVGAREALFEPYLEAFGRLKEEGKTRFVGLGTHENEPEVIRAAIESGFKRAWPAIRDSNITTFIVCAILYWLGSSIIASAPVMGFAATLAIGVAVSMFSAFVVTRTFLRIFAGTRLAQKTSLFSVYSGRKND